MYVDGLVKKYGSHLEGITRNYDTPMSSTDVFSDSDMPLKDSPEYSAMAVFRAIYASLVGAFLWLSSGTRSDITFATSVLARYISNPCMAHFRAALRVLIYLRHTKHFVLPLGKMPYMNEILAPYTDATWADTASVSGFAGFYHGSLFSWYARKQPVPTRASGFAETLALDEAVHDIIWERHLLTFMGLPQIGPTVVRTDSTTTVAQATNPVNFKKTKHFLNVTAYIRDLTKRQVIKAIHVPGTEQIADFFTKPLARAPFTRFRDIFVGAREDFV